LGIVNLILLIWYFIKLRFFVAADYEKHYLFMHLGIALYKYILQKTEWLLTRNGGSENPERWPHSPELWLKVPRINHLLHIIHISFVAE